MDPAQQHVSQLISGFWAAQVINAAVVLGLPDLLDQGPLTPEALAAAAQAHAPSLHRLLRALVSLGLCRHQDGGRFALTEAGGYLRKDAEGSVRGRALFTGDMLWKQFGDLTQQVKTGGRTQAVVSGAEGFAVLAQDPPRLHAFQQAMAESSVLAAREALKLYDFSRFARVLDLGGGYGGVLSELLAARPEQTGAVFDLAYLETGAAAYLERAGVATRARFIGGSFFESVPGGFDLILMKYIVHDWGDEDALAILGKARASANAGATLVLLEQVVPEVIEVTAQHQAAIRGDLTMMGMGGKERTAEEFRVLLADAGWRLTRIVSSPAALSVIEAQPA